MRLTSLTLFALPLAGMARPVSQSRPKDIAQRSNGEGHSHSDPRISVRSQGSHSHSDPRLQGRFDDGKYHPDGAVGGAASSSPVDAAAPSSSAEDATSSSSVDDGTETGAPSDIADSTPAAESTPAKSSSARVPGSSATPRPSGSKTASRPGRSGSATASHSSAKPHPSGSSNSSSGNGTQEIGVYFTSWGNNTVDQINFDLFDRIYFSFAIPKEDFTIGWGEGDEEKTKSMLQNLVDKAHEANKKVSLTFGGWTGSKYFSDAVASEESRSKFSDEMANMVKDTGVDGCDIDWEYPGRDGADGNKFSPDDADNFLEFLKELKGKLPDDSYLSVAVGDPTFIGKDGQPMTDVKDFGDVIDSLLLMNYDIFNGASTEPGPNAPLTDKCQSSKKDANGEAAVEAWTKAGFPASKLTLGIASYGYKFASDADKLVARQDAANNKNTPFSKLLAEGKLVKSDDGSYTAGEGFTREWDDCSSTPFIRNADTKEIYTYDDPESLKLKAEFVVEKGLLGTGMWDLGGDTEDFDLTKTLKDVFGGSSSDSNSDDPETSSASGVKSHGSSATRSAHPSASSTKSAGHASTTKSKSPVKTGSSSSGEPTSSASEDAPSASPSVDATPENDDGEVDQ